MIPGEVTTGMRVRFREWDDMDRESRERYAVGKSGRYTYDPDRLFAGGDEESYVFLISMAGLCGGEFTVGDISANYRITPASFVLENGARLNGHIIEPWMLEPADPAFNEELPEADTDSLLGFPVKAMRISF